MSQEKHLIDLPPVPTSPNNQGYWLVYGEWFEIAQKSAIATPENPNPAAQPMQRKIGVNEIIDIHPAVFYISAQTSRPFYTIKWAMSVSKEIYLWYKEVERRAERVAKQMQEKKP